MEFIQQNEYPQTCRVLQNNWVCPCGLPTDEWRWATLSLKLLTSGCAGLASVWTSSYFCAFVWRWISSPSGRRWFRMVGKKHQRLLKAQRNDPAIWLWVKTSYTIHSWACHRGVWFWVATTWTQYFQFVDVFGHLILWGNLNGNKPSHYHNSWQHI